MGRFGVLTHNDVIGGRAGRPSVRRISLLAADVLTMTAAAASIVSVLGAFSGKADQAANFAPMWAGLGLVAGGTSLGLSRKRAGRAAMLATVIAGACWLMAPELAAKRPAIAPGAPTTRILTLNTWILNKVPDETLRWITSQNADALVLSELQPWSPLRADLLKTYPYLVPCRTTGPCSTVIMTRTKPIEQGGLATGDADRRQDISAVWATVRTSGEPITILGLHLDHPGPMGTGRDETVKIRDFLHGRDNSRLVVIGDTNRTPWSHAMRVLDKSVGIARVTHGMATWPAGRAYPPLFGIDQAYIGPSLGLARIERSPDVGSDHRGFVIDVGDAKKG